MRRRPCTTPRWSIRSRRRERYGVVRDTIELFDSHEAVVTDRFHGVIFGIICRKPVVVLRTVDHKLTSAVEWFKDIANVQFCDTPDQIGATLERVRKIPVDHYPDFNALYFDRLPQLIDDMAYSTEAPGHRHAGAADRAAACEDDDRQRTGLGRPRQAAASEERRPDGADRAAAEILRPCRHASKLSNDELLAFMRHDAHRIEKSFYNRIFHSKRSFYESRRDNVKACIALLRQRGFDTSEATVAWADRIATQFAELEDAPSSSRTRPRPSRRHEPSGPDHRPCRVAAQLARMGRRAARQ